MQRPVCLNKWHSAHFLGHGSSLSGIPLHSWQSGSSPLAGGQPGAAEVKEPPQATAAWRRPTMHAPTKGLPASAARARPRTSARGEGLRACRGPGRPQPPLEPARKQSGRVSVRFHELKEGSPVGRGWEASASLGSPGRQPTLWARHRGSPTASTVPVTAGPPWKCLRSIQRPPAGRKYYEL